MVYNLEKCLGIINVIILEAILTRPHTRAIANEQLLTNNIFRQYLLPPGFKHKQCSSNHVII